MESLKIDGHTFYLPAQDKEKIQNMLVTAKMLNFEAWIKVVLVGENSAKFNLNFYEQGSILNDLVVGITLISDSCDDLNTATITNYRLLGSSLRDNDKILDRAYKMLIRELEEIN